jgi:ABC-type antimicrobial peptide transport system permease subunit
VKVQSLGEPPTPLVYRPLTKHTALLRVVARSSGDPVPAVAQLRDTVDAIDSRVAVFDSGTVSGVLDVMLFPFRMIAALGTALGLFAVVLAGVGLYGIAAFTLASRRRELAIRVALGAAPGRVVRLVLGDGLAAVIAGLAVGVPVAYVVAVLSRSWLFGVGPADPAAFAAAALVLAATAVAAGVGPARGALRSEPWSALRAD